MYIVQDSFSFFSFTVLLLILKPKLRVLLSDTEYRSGTRAVCSFSICRLHYMYVKLTEVDVFKIVLLQFYNMTEIHGLLLM